MSWIGRFRLRPIRMVLSFTAFFVLLTVFDVIKIFPSISAALREANNRLQQYDLAVFDLPMSSSSKSATVTGSTPNVTTQEAIQKSPQPGSSTVSTKTSSNKNFQNPLAGQTKIVAFTDHGFRFVAANWYERLQALGYTTHTIVAVDTSMVKFLNSTNATANYRYDVMLRPNLRPALASHPYNKKLRYVVEQIFAIRWQYILEQLQQGVHILMTDCDNIFTRHMPLSELEESEFDVYHAFETRHPGDVFEKQGFCVCGGMSWFRASPKVIQLVRMIIAECNEMCDDQVILNRIILNQLNMTWDSSPYQLGPVTSNQTEDRFNGLPQFGVSGTSGLTGHRVKIWDRDVAFRGSLKPNPCPANNWVSMPLFDAYMRRSVWMDKLKAFEVWDRNCGGANNTFGIQYLPQGFHDRYNKRPMKLER